MDIQKKIDVVKSSYASLVENLPINEILLKLFARGVLTSTAVKDIRNMPTTQDKTMYLLDNFILRSLKVGVPELFDKFVEVLIEPSQPNEAAKALGKRLQAGEVKDDSHPPSSPALESPKEKCM